MFRELLLREPRNADAHIGLGSALEAEGQLSGAEESYREATRIEPGYWNTYNWLGTFLVQRGRAAEAAAAFEHVTELAPGNSSGHNNLGTALLMSGQLDAAAASFRRSIAIDPARAAYGNLGIIYYLLHQYATAAEMFSKAIELAPEDFEVRGGRADVLWQMEGRRDDALADYRVAIRRPKSSSAIDPSSALAWAQLGCYYGRIGDAARSAEAIQRALAIAPDDGFVSYYAAIAAADRGDHAAAARLVSQAVAQGYSEALVKADPVIARYGAGNSAET